MGEPWKMKMSLKMKLIFFRIEGENIVDSDQPFKKRSERMVLNLTHGRFALALHKSVWELHICCHGGKELRRFALALHKSVRELHICCHGGKELCRYALALRRSVRELHICCHGGKELRMYASALRKSVWELRRVWLRLRMLLQPGNRCRGLLCTSRPGSCRQGAARGILPW